MVVRTAFISALAKKTSTKSRTVIPVNASAVTIKKKAENSLATTVKISAYQEPSIDLSVEAPIVIARAVSLPPIAKHLFYWKYQLRERI